jgi:hypothetical protein
MLGELPSSPVVLEGNRWACIEPDYKNSIKDANLRRRMSRIVKIGVSAAMECVRQSGVDPDAIITATGLGCLADTEKFLSALTDQQEQQLNPTPFIQSTFNTVGAQTALLLGNHGYNTTYVHRGCSFESALLDAKIQIDEGNAGHVLVGCFDETTDVSFEIMRRMGFWKKDPGKNSSLYQDDSRGTVSGEGAAFFMLSKQPTPQSLPISISDVYYFNQPVDHNSGEHLYAFLSSRKYDISGIDLLILGNNGDTQGDKIYQEIARRFFPGIPYCFFKNLCGEYSTASGFALSLASGILIRQEIGAAMSFGNISRKIKNVLIINHFQRTSYGLIRCTIETI